MANDKDGIKEWPFPTSAHEEILAPTIVPNKPDIDLESDKPLEGGACDLGGSCESCQ